MKTLSIDIETYSDIPLQKTGVYRYCESPNFEILLFGYSIDSGPVQVVYRNICHPYTVGLFGSLPDLDKDTHRLTPIPGMMPDPSELPEGCPFAPRCPKGRPECLGPVPYREVDGGRVRCLYPEGGTA